MQQQIAERIDHLLTLPLFGPAQYQELKDIDTQLTHILTKADHECCPKSNAPWSPALNQAYLRHRYWSIALTTKRNNRDMKEVLQPLRARITPVPDDEFEQTRSISANLRKAQKLLRKEKCEADLL